MQKQKLEAHLYDLLLYEKGSFFLPHKDGEKLDRMVATLVIVLPSEHEGGELIVRHDGREEVIDFGAADNNPFEIHFAAFYADCEHEVRPVRKGHRLCLVYNLTLATGKKGITAPRPSEHGDRVAALLEKWAQDPAARKLVVTLDHEYTEKGVAWDALKGADRTIANVLAEAAERADCRAYLGLLTYHEMGSGHTVGGDDYDYRNRWSRDDDEEEADDDNTGSGDYEMDEVIEESLSAEHCKDRAGKTTPFDELRIDEEELLDPEALRAVDPQEEFEGYTGNAGMTLDRWYRHAAIILWPEKRHFDVVCGQSPRAGVELLTELVAKWGKASKKAAPALKEPCVALAQAVFATWRKNEYYHGHSDDTKTDPLFPLLAKLDDATLIDRYLGELMPKDVGLDPGKSLAAVCKKHGWQTFEPRLLAIFKATTAPDILRNVRVLEHLALAEPGADDGWSWLCESLAQEVVSALERIDFDKTVPEWRQREVKRNAILLSLIPALVAANQPTLLERVAKHTFEQPKLYPLTEVHLPVIAKLQAWLGKNARPNVGLSHWLTACRQQLEALTTVMPTKPTDFRRPAAANCKCADCQELNHFLADPREEVHRSKAGQQRRRHLEEKIRAFCDADCKTDTRTSPQTLICTKNTNSYKAALKKYHEDQKHLAMVRAIDASLPK